MLERIMRNICAVAILTISIGTGVMAEDPPKQEAAAPPPSPISQLLSQEKYAEALAAAEAALKVDPANVDDQVYRIDALMGLDRDMEALRLAVPLAGQNQGRPGIRYRVGKCAYKLGMLPQATQAWSALYSCPDKEWAGLAYCQSARVLLIQGQELEARKLVADAMAKWPDPPSSLIRLSLEINPSVAEGLKNAELGMKLDPKDKADFEAQRQLFAEAGEGELFQEAPAGDAPVTFKLKEKSETRHTTSFVWGATDMDSTYEMTTSSRVVVPVILNGSKDRPMLLDSGSDSVLVTKDVVKELGLKPVSTASYLGIGYEGVRNSSWVLIKNLTIGTFTMKNVPAMVIEENNDFWKETGGLVPLSLFDAHGVLYDRRGGKITLYPSGTKPEAVLRPGSFSVKSLWYAGKPHVEVKVQEKAGLNFLVDTGAWTTFIAGQYAQELGVHINRAADTRKTSGLSGSALSGQANDVTLWLGPARFKLSPCQVMEIFEEGGVKRYGILGRNVLDQFAIYFDYRSNVVAFKAYDR